MRVLQISPTFFDPASVVGGGERYAWEVSRALARKVDVTFLTFGDRDQASERDGVHVEIVRRSLVGGHPLAANPLRRRFFAAISRADVVHAHQVHTFATNAAVLGGWLRRRPVFVTDLGGGHVRAPSSYVPVMRLSAGFLLLSEYSRARWARAPRRSRPDRLDVIYGGVDTAAFQPGGSRSPNDVLFAGRLVPHKGVEHLIDAIAPPLRLRVVGRPYDRAYADMLRDRARGKDVLFEQDIDDAGLIERMRGAFAVVQPSVAIDWRGHTTDVAELFGLVAVEAMACETPVIVARTGSLPELVEDGATGHVVPPGDGRAIRERLLALHADPAGAADMGRRARARVLERFTWDATAARCLDAYGRAA